MIRRSIGGRPPPPNSVGQVSPIQPSGGHLLGELVGVAVDPRVVEAPEPGDRVGGDLAGLGAQGELLGGPVEVHRRPMVGPRTARRDGVERGGRRAGLELGVVERRRGAHHGRRLVGVGAVVATEVDGRALDGEQLAGDLLLVLAQRLGQPGERRRQVRVVGLRGQLLGPVQGEVEVAAAVVDLADPPGRRLVLVEERAGGPVERVGEHLGAGVAGRDGVLLEADGQGEELAEAVPAQVVLLDQLLHVLRRRAAGAGLEQPAAVDQRDDRQHLGAGAELHDREQVGEVVAQHVAGDRDRVLAAADALERERDRVDRGHDPDVEAGRCRGPAGRSRPW